MKHIIVLARRGVNVAPPEQTEWDTAAVYDGMYAASQKGANALSQQLMGALDHLEVGPGDRVTIEFKVVTP